MIRAKLSVLALMFPLREPAAASEFHPIYLESSASICFERPEEPGRSNIEEVTVTIGEMARISVLGGTAACIYVPENNYDIKVRYPIELGGAASKTKYSTVKAQNLFARRGTTTTFSLCGAYTSWQLIAAAADGSARCPITDHEADQLQHSKKR